MCQLTNQLPSRFMAVLCYDLYLAFRLPSSTREAHLLWVIGRIRRWYAKYKVVRTVEAREEYNGRVGGDGDDFLGVKDSCYQDGSSSIFAESKCGVIGDVKCTSPIKLGFIQEKEITFV